MLNQKLGLTLPVDRCPHWHGIQSWYWQHGETAPGWQTVWWMKWLTRYEVALHQSRSRCVHTTDLHLWSGIEKFMQDNHKPQRLIFSPTLVVYSIIIKPTFLPSPPTLPSKSLSMITFTIIKNLLHIERIQLKTISIFLNNTILPNILNTILTRYWVFLF